MIEDIKHLFSGDWEMDPIPEQLTEFKVPSETELREDWESLKNWDTGFNEDQSGGYVWADEGFSTWFKRKFKEGFPTNPNEPSFFEALEIQQREMSDWWNNMPRGGRNDWPDVPWFTPFVWERKAATLEALHSCKEFGKKVWGKTRRLLANS